MSQRPSVPKGTRDFSPEEMYKRLYVMDTLRSVFHLFGFQPIETPSFENLDTLMGKYGEEGDRLIFKIVRSGDFLAKATPADLDARDSLKVGNQISDKALRYDLTVPFARYVVQHQSELAFPFKRYQIQPVWRADRPQRGRFREFYQCDADMVGSDSLWNEVELVQLYDEAFTQLGMKTIIRMNNRKILAGIAEVADIEDKLIDFTVALDKLDKIGPAGVMKEWEERGISATSVEMLKKILVTTRSNEQWLSFLEELLAPSEMGRKGIEELKFVFENVARAGLHSAKLQLDITLARGLNYYTGAIFEVTCTGIDMGSIGGGGRYDDLTGIFGMPNLSGVGISFGLDRICICLDELDLYPINLGRQTRVLFAYFGDEESAEALKIIRKLRQAGINAELYPDKAKMKKQFDYAMKKGIPFLAMLGGNEIENNVVQLKDLTSGEQKALNHDELISALRK